MGYIRHHPNSGYAADRKRIKKHVNTFEHTVQGGMFFENLSIIFSKMITNAEES